MATVFQFEKYSVTSDSYERSRRWATLDAIRKAQGEPIGKGVEVPDEHVGREIEGMTEINYLPPSLRREGFRHEVRS